MHAYTAVQIVPEHYEGGGRTALILKFSNTQSEGVICSCSSGTSKRKSSSLSTGNTIALMNFSSFNLLFECSTTDLVKYIKDLLNLLCPLFYQPLSFYSRLP